MTTTPSLGQRIRANIHLIELTELGTLGVAFAGLANVLAPPDSLSITFFSLVLAPGALWALWGIYMLFITIGRATGRRVEFAIWIVAAAMTASFTFWCWTVLDINRLLMSKLFYQGSRPVEYAWRTDSKQRARRYDAMRRSA
jgi:hypothetical protein